MCRKKNFVEIKKTEADGKTDKIIRRINGTKTRMLCKVKYVIVIP